MRFSNNQIVYSAVYSTISKVLDGTSSALEIIKEDGGELLPPEIQAQPIQSEQLAQIGGERAEKAEKTPIIVPSEIRALVSGVLKGFLPKVRVIAKEELSKDLDKKDDKTLSLI